MKIDRLLSFVFQAMWSVLFIAGTLALTGGSW